ncbi:MAG: PAS domain S-box protein [Candidatus Pacebacteria bacterium]|nr:PAS domain S-box protein [Candidatus Paceibacterota bacterium]
MKIKTKIILPIVLTAVIVLTAATFYSYFFNVNALKTTIESHLETTTQSRARSVDIFLEEQVDKIRIAATHSSLSNEELKIIRDSNTEFSEVFLLDATGKIIKSSNEIRIGLDRSTDDYFINTKEGGYIKDAYVSKITGEPSIAVSIPYGQEILVARMGLEVLNDITTDKTGLGNKGEVYLINSGGYAITPLLFKEDTFLNFKIESENAENCLSMNGFKNKEIITHSEPEHIGHKPSIIYTDYRGVGVLGSHYPLRTMSWCLLAEVNEVEALASTKDLLRFSIIRILIVLSTFFIITYLLAKTISKPIITLSQGTKIIKKGNLDYKVGIDSQDEIGQLSRDFDEMTTAIKKSRAEVDQKVKVQTKEIIEKQKDIENQQLATLNILEDVKEEKELTEIERDKIDTILQSIGDGVFVVDKDYKISIFNKVASKISGFSLEEALGQDCRKILKFLDEKNRTPNYSFLEETFSTGKIQMMKNHTILIRKDGSEVAVADSSAPIKDNAGHIIGCIVVFRDASAERKAEQIKSDFVSIASHQLRTPLTGIQWVTERLLKKSSALPEKDKQYINDINLSSKKLSRLVDNLLNVSRIEGGRIGIKPQEIDLIDFINSYLSETNSLTEKKNIQLSFEKHPENLKISNDPSALRNIIQSLVSNAIEYTPQGGKINVFVEDLENNFLFKVSDTGIGIPPQNQATIFDKFTRGENAQQVKTDGTGFGLYIAKQTVDLLGGKIHFESVLDEGTTFFVELPKKVKTIVGGKSFV